MKLCNYKKVNSSLTPPPIADEIFNLEGKFMKPIALLLLTIFLAPGLCFAAEDQCDLFKKAVRTSVGIDLPPTLEAGKSYTFESSLTIADELALNAVDPNSHIIFWHSFRNNIPGSNGSNSEPSYDITRLKLKKTGESVSAKNTFETL